MSKRKKWLTGLGLLAAIAAFVLLGLAWHARSDMLGPEGNYFESNGVRIHYTDEGQGVPVLLVHGFANPANLQWRKTGLIEALTKEHRVIALDNRGHGRSDKPHDPSHYGVQMMEDLVRLLDHLKIEKTHVVGYSMGGYITLKLVAKHPERIISAAACGAGWEKSNQENRDFAEAVAKGMEQGEFSALFRRLGIAESSVTPWQKISVWLFISYFNDPLALAAVARGSQELALSEEELRANKVPTLTIMGSDDGLLPNAQELTKNMANHELFLIEGRNHINTDMSDAFLETLRAFLAKHTP